MTKYRIIKLKHYNNLYIAQKRFWFIFWTNLNTMSSEEFCEWIIQDRINQDKAKVNNPKDIIVKEF